MPNILDLLFGSAFSDLVNRVTNLENKEQSDMSTLTDAISQLNTAFTANKAATDQEFSTLTSSIATINTSLTDLKAAINSQPDETALVAQITPLITALQLATEQANQSTANIQALATTAQSADPGAPTSAPVNS